MGVRAMEDGEVLLGLRKEEDGLGDLIDWREVDRGIGRGNGEDPKFLVGSNRRHEVVGSGIDLEFTIPCTAHEVTDADDLGVESTVIDRLNQGFLGLDLGIYVFVGNVLPEEDFGLMDALVLRGLYVPKPPR